MLGFNFVVILFLNIRQEKPLSQISIFLLSCQFQYIFFSNLQLLDWINRKDNILVSSVMKKLVLLITTFILSIKIMMPNLIRFGDFENLVKINYPNKFKSCGSICNNTWFASKGSIQIGIGNNHTATVDMNNDFNFKLCQNVSSMEIQKTYIFTFDMLCVSLNINCSMWAIINDRVVNGTNHTMQDHSSHTIVGYFISKQSKNKICFQSHENPTIKGSGARIDNITLKLFNGIIPCNAYGCISCVLNFPNSCQVCQTGYVKQMNQTCTLCSTIISNCAQCQRIITLYTCLQCSSQFLLNSQRNFCYHNSEIFFASQFSETTSIENIFIIKTNLSIALLFQAGFSTQNLPSILIQINNNKQQKLALTINKNGFLEIKVKLAYQQQSFTINLQIEQGFVQINNTYFSIRSSVSKKPSIFLSEIQKAIFFNYDAITQPIIQNLDATFGIIKSSGFGFFVTNIFTYLSLMTFYKYLNTYQPKTFRLFIENLSSNLNSFSFYSFINLQTQVYEIGKYQVVEKIKKPRQEWSGPLQDGFSTNFYKNNLQPFTIITAFTVRLIFCWLLHKIFNAGFLQASNSQRFISICQQFQTIIPIIILPSFNLIIKSIASRNYVESINTIFHIIILFACLMNPFVHLLTQLYQIQRKILKDHTKIQKQRKKLQLQIKNNSKISDNQNLKFQIQSVQAFNSQLFKELDQRKKQFNQEQKKKKVQAKFKLVYTLKLLSIPIFVVFQQVLPFILIVFCLLLIEFVLSLKLRKYFSTYRFAFNTIISLAWVFLHCSFCFYYVIQQWFFDQWSVSKALQVSKYVGYSSIVIILFGAVVQILYCLIDFILFLKLIVTYLYKKCKKSSKITFQSENKYQTKRQNVNQSGNKKQPDSEIRQKIENIINCQNSTNSVKNQDLFSLYKSQAQQNKKRISKLKTQMQVSRNLFSIQQLQKQQKSKRILELKSQMQESGNLFTFQQPQSYYKSKEISNIKTQTQASRKIKKVKEKEKIFKLKVKFQTQN